MACRTSESGDYFRKLFGCFCWAVILAFGVRQTGAGAGDASLNGLINRPLGVPAIPVPASNPVTRDKIELGKQLFFDRRLSEDETLSCASCHVPERAFSDNLRTSRGLRGAFGKRNTPTLVNVALQPYQFWDGRSSSLEDQALRPLEHPLEMGGRLDQVLERLNGIPAYRSAFYRAFGSLATRESVAQALASFERTILAGDSPYDRHLSGEQQVMSALALEGMRLFNGKAHCHICHSGSNLSDGLFHNLGVGWDGQRSADEGRFIITGIIKDKGAFKTPTLRQIAQTAPYMHDGSLPTLEAVVEFYDRGGISNPHLDPLIQPRRLSASEKKALVEFLRSLSGQVRFY